MARITVEDCQEKISCPFTLVEVAAARARQIHNAQHQQFHPRGIEPAPGAVAGEQRSEEEDRPTVQALREISRGEVGEEVLRHQELEDRMHAFRSQIQERDGNEDLFHRPDGL